MDGCKQTGKILDILEDSRAGHTVKQDLSKGKWFRPQIGTDNLGILKG